jgi:menaquinone-dependent protoporphyrinogen oxidase
MPFAVLKAGKLFIASFCEKTIMKTLIVYDTKYGTTQTIAHWLSKATVGDCDVVNVADVGDVASLDYDLIIVGSPIYVDDLLPSVKQFLLDERDALSEKNVAVFFVYDDLLTLKSKTYVEELREYAPPNVIAVGVFGGYFNLNALNEDDRRTMEDFFNRLGKRYEVLDHRNKREVMRFGKLVCEKLT